MNSMDNETQKLIDIAKRLADEQQTQFHVIGNFLGNREIISADQLQRFYLSYPTIKFQFSTTTQEQKAS